MKFWMILCAELVAGNVPTLVAQIPVSSESEQSVYRSSKTAHCTQRVPAVFEEAIGVDSVDNREKISLLSTKNKLKYPDEQRKKGHEGWVLFEFVTDTAGAVEPCSVHVAELSDRAFVQNAGDFLITLRYQPGIFHGIRVRTILRQKINFSIAR